MHHELEFPLKGKRNYVHGTSLFNAIVSIARDEGFSSGRANISFKHMLENTLCTVEHRKPTASDAVAAELQADDGSRLHLCINPAERKGAVQREEYDEAAICRGSALGERSIALDGATHDDAIEIVVSLCKKMHLDLVDDSRKWVFSRYLGAFPLPPIKHLEIIISKQVGTHLTCNEVRVAGKKIGEVFFSC